MGKKVPIPFFLDNCVADSVGRALIEAGHEVVFLRDCMPPDTKDPVVAIACVEMHRVLVTHDQDFRAIAKSLNMTQRNYRGLHRISLRCSEPRAASRIEAALSLIEFEWARGGRGQNQMVIEIGEAAIRVLR